MEKEGWQLMRKKPALGTALLTLALVVLLLLSYGSNFRLGEMQWKAPEYSFIQEHFMHILKGDPEVHMNVTRLVTSKGYPCEEHDVRTEDGYLLGIQRIPGPRDRKRPPNSRPAVLLQHGLLCSASNWVTNLANQSLGFLLADAGYDVWLGNSRGNTYSRRHIKYSPAHERFWDFSWDEMGQYDLPAVIDYILNVTGQTQIYYIGHSQGTLLAFSGLSRNHSLASKVKHFFALGPVITVEYIQSPIKYFSLLTDWEMKVLLGKKDFLPSDWLMKLLASTVCNADTRIFCSNVVFLLAGFDVKQLNQSRLPVYLSHTPAGTSVQDVIHFAQMVRSGKFQMYDYGSCKENVQRYHQCDPPLYNASAMKTPVSLFYAENDWLADPKDVKRLIPQLSNLTDVTWIEKWDHLDFIWGLDAADKVYKPIIKTMKKLDGLS